MPKFVYQGPGARLVIARRTLVAGQEVELSGAAAEAAANHPRIRRAEAKAKSTPATPAEPAWGATVETAIAYAGEDPAKAREVLDAEHAKGDKARKSLIEALDPIANGGNGS